MRGTHHKKARQRPAKRRSNRPNIAAQLHRERAFWKKWREQNSQESF